MKYEIAIERVLPNEGEYVNDPRDPGGETKWGISKRTYPDLDIANLRREDAIAIYRRDFWSVIDGDELPDALAFQALDFAVNSGCDTAVRYLQKAAGVADDGHVGPHTLEALNAMPPAVLLITFLALRLQYMTRLKNWRDASAGWANRIANDLLLGAQDLLT